MKINKLIADGVYGSLKFNIDFDNQVTFLIGINGSGKTTALNLLNALLTPSFDILTKIDFEKAKVICSSNKKEKDIAVSISRLKNGLCKIYFNNKGKIYSNKFLKEIFRSIPEDSFIDEEEYVSRQRNDFYKLEVVKKIRELTPSIFLELNREVKENRNDQIDFARRKMTYHRGLSQKRYSITESIDESLRHIQNLLFDFIRIKIPNEQQKIIEDFKNEILSLSFIYLKSKKIDIPEIKDLENIKEQIKLAIKNMNITNIDSKINIFFENILDALKKYADDNKEIKNEPPDTLWPILTNIPQIKRIQKIVSLSEKYRNKILKLHEPFRKLEKIISQFLKEGNKELKVDNKGVININILQKSPKEGEDPKKLNRNIYQLSSGEKQILIIIAHLIFYEELQKSEIFIVDEPELSLHITWQEIFVNSIIEASPSTQFILATHAPSIIAKREREENCIDLSTSN